MTENLQPQPEAKLPINAESALLANDVSTEAEELKKAKDARGLLDKIADRFKAKSESKAKDPGNKIDKARREAIVKERNDGNKIDMTKLGGYPLALNINEDPMFKDKVKAAEQILLKKKE